MNTRIKRLSAINYFGSKSRHLDWILPWIPEHKVYLEPFCGSASIFFNKQPSPVECINDLNGRLINFFRVLRDNYQDLACLLDLTPYSREEFIAAGEISPDPIEDARRFFVRALLSFGGITHNTRRINSYRIDLQESRQGMACCVSKYLTKIEGLEGIVNRLKMAQIDNRNAFFLIPKYDVPDAFQYQDPPYQHRTRTGNNDYEWEITHGQHTELAELNNKLKCKVMISHTDDHFYDELYPKPKWTKVLGPVRMSNLGKGMRPREAIWMNYKLQNQ